MHPVVEREQLSPNVVRLVVEAPRIAKVRRPGQFVIVRIGPGGERIPLTIADNDAEAGTITLMIQAVGVSTTELTNLQVGDVITDVAGPLGQETELVTAGHAVTVGGGVGTAVILPIARELSRRGVHVTSVIGGRSKEWVILEPELRAWATWSSAPMTAATAATASSPRPSRTSWTPAASTPSTRSAPCR